MFKLSRYISDIVDGTYSQAIKIICVVSKIAKGTLKPWRDTYS